MSGDGNHADDSTERSGREPVSQWRRRGVLKAAGAGITGLGLGASASAGAAQDRPFAGPFPNAYESAVVDPTSVPVVSSDPRGEREGEGDEPPREVPRGAPPSDGNGRGGGGNAQRRAAREDIVGADFDGLTALDFRGIFPSDNQVAAGRDHVFEAINSRVALFDKGGSKASIEHAQAGTIDFEFTLDDWFQNVSPFVYEEGDPEREGDDDTSEFFEDYIVFDPRARYDAAADRYLLCCVDQALSGDRAGRGAWLLSVSSSSDPTDPWYNYRIPPIPQQEGQRGTVDFPLLGFDDEAVYLSQNFFPDGFTQATTVALEKDAVYAGETADANHFTQLRNPDGSLAFTVQPAAIESGSDAGYFVNTRFFQGQSLTVWTIEDPVGDPTLTQEAVRVRPYHNAPEANQPGTEEQIDTLDTRARRVSFDGEHLWTAHTTTGGRVRWYEIDPTDPAVVQSGEFRRSGRSTFIPAIESTGDDAVFVYNTSSPRGNGEGGVHVEAATVTPGGDGEVDAFAVVKEGEGPYDYQDPEEDDDDRGPQTMRWGDYNGVSVDPEDGSVWVVGQYAMAVDAEDDHLEDDNYGTRIARIDP